MCVPLSSPPLYLCLEVCICKRNKHGEGSEQEEEGRKMSQQQKEEKTKEEKTIVLYPSPGIGHLISMVELGKRFLSLPNSPFSTITIFITEAPFNTGSTAPYISRVSSSHPSISFHQLPSIPLSSLETKPASNHETLIFRLLRLNNHHVFKALQSISLSFSISALIFDFFCVPSLRLSSSHLNIPSYCFFTSGAQVLAVFLHFPAVHQSHTSSFKDLPSTHLLHVPGVIPFPANELPLPMLDRNCESYQGFLDTTTDLPKSTGIIINTFEALEPRAIKSIADGSCVPDGPTPPIYCIGPLISTGVGDQGRPDGDGSECLAWLDSQPPRSVVFLCFGSLGLFSVAQLKEIAVALEESGQRFLWVVRSPPIKDTSQRFLAAPEPDLDALLPEGFLERTKDRGMVVKSWAPQVAVLNRESVGGFVTHCGWNSVLEAVCAGVPLVAWPLYAEQHMNRDFLVEEMKLALPLEMDNEGFVSATELERRVRGLMESEEGESLSQRMTAMKEMATAALSEGGSSYSALSELAESWKQGH